MSRRLQVIRPVPFGPLNVLGLRSFGAASEKYDHGRPDLPEVDAIPRTKHESRFPDAATHRLVITQVPGLEAEDPRLSTGFHRRAERIEPHAVRTLPVGGEVFPDDEFHRPFNLNPARCLSRRCAADCIGLNWPMGIQA